MTPTQRQPAIEITNLSRQFGHVRALDGLTFTVYEGEVFGLLGPNGAGKTTTVRLLNGVLAPSSGAACVLGRNPATDGEAIRCATGVLTETPALYERLTARENLRIFGALYGVPEAALPRRVAELLDLFDLADRAGDKAGGFSKGMKQRLALARALVHDPRLLFLDEPTAGLDPEVTRQVNQLIVQLSQRHDRTIILCTHNLAEAQRLCDRVAVLHAGRLLAVGTPADLARTLWQGLWVDVELRVAPPTGLVRHLSALPGVAAVEQTELRLAIQVNGDEDVPPIVAALAAEGAQVMRVNPREHTLEEVYFALQAQQKEGAQ